MACIFSTEAPSSPYALKKRFTQVSKRGKRFNAGKAKWVSTNAPAKAAPIPIKVNILPIGNFPINSNNKQTTKIIAAVEKLSFAIKPQINKIGKIIELKLLFQELK